MIQLCKKYSFLFILALVPFIGHANEQAVKPAHKPPILTTTAIIEVYEGEHFKGIVLIERGKAPWGKAIPGGKVEYGETVENAVRREMMEEVNLELNDLRQFHVYSDPSRDFRHHSVEVAHTAKAFQAPTAGDDAAKAFIVKLEDIPWNELAFDHAQVLKDYMEWRNGKKAVAVDKP
jgi:8-oxo-dGTP diphosphatase